MAIKETNYIDVVEIKYDTINNEWILCDPWFSSEFESAEELTSEFATFLNDYLEQIKQAALNNYTP